MRLTSRKRLSGPKAEAQRALSESGSALAMVLAIFAITILLSTLAASASVSGLTFTSATRAGIQSQASAEAGINYTIKQMVADQCANGGNYAVGNTTGRGAYDLNFTVKVYARPTQTATWRQGCPSAAVGGTDHFVRLVSTGTPKFNGVPSKLGDSRSVEAVYEWSPAYFVTNIRPSGPAIYSSGSAKFAGSSQLKNPDLLPSVVAVAHGDAGCGQSSQVNADVVVADGGWASGGSCIVIGNVWANGPMTNKQSSGITKSVWATSLDMSFSSSIVGDGWVGGNTNMIESRTLTGHLTTASRSGPGVPGSQTIDPGLNGQPPRLPAGIKPVPDWVNFKYKNVDWPGFVYHKMDVKCTATNMQAALTRMAVTSPGSSQTLDLRECETSETAVITWNDEMVLQNDVLILAPKMFAIADSGKMRSLNGPHKVWIVQEDLVDEPKPDQAPTCPTGGYLALGESYGVTADVSTMVYTPCHLTLGLSAVWRGQFYAGQVTVSESASLAYVPGGLPGVDLSTGIHSPDDSSSGTGYFASVYGDQISIRDLDKTD